MSQKINPVGIRTGTFLPWKSRWFTENKGNYQNNLIEDINLRKALMEKLALAGITLVEIERLPKSMVIYLNVSRPGVVIGRGGTGIEEIKKFILKIIFESRKGGKSAVEIKKDMKIEIKVSEVKNPELSAYLVAARIVSELERRLPHRRVVTKALERMIASGAKGAKIVLAGRIGGAEISRVEKYKKGSVPTQTLREDIDYASTRALLKRGYVGVKVWIHQKEV